MAKLIMTSAVYQDARRHLLSDRSEHAGFFECGVAESPNGPIHLAERFRPIEDRNLAESNELGFRLSDEVLVEVVNSAVKSGHALVEAHSHPFGTRHPSFSNIDEDGLASTAPYMLRSLPGRPYGATVWGKSGVSGLSWADIASDEQNLEVLVVGPILRRLDARGAAADIDHETFDRQIRAFGEPAQRQLAGLRVAVIGCGGLGAHLIQQLAYLGVRSFLLIDPDVIERTNLNRIPGAIPNDVGAPKVQVMARLIKSLAPESNVLTYQQDARDVLDHVKAVDVIFGGVDGDGVRLVLNRISRAYLVPYIDCGTEISLGEDGMPMPGGRVNVVVPGGPCLICAGEIDLSDAGYELASDKERELAEKRGYVPGVTAPAVISLNGLVASAGVTELLNLVAELRPVAYQLIYDMLGNGTGKDSQWLVPRRIAVNPQCTECAYSGTGDSADLARFALGGNTTTAA